RADRESAPFPCRRAGDVADTLALDGNRRSGLGHHIAGDLQPDEALSYLPEVADARDALLSRITAFRERNRARDQRRLGDVRALVEVDAETRPAYRDACSLVFSLTHLVAREFDRRGDQYIEIARPPLR